MTHQHTKALPKANYCAYCGEPIDGKSILTAMDMGIVGSELPRVEHIIELDEPFRWNWYEQDNNAGSPLEQDLE